MSIEKSVVLRACESWRLTKRPRNALTFCLLVLLIVPLSAISWTVSHGHVALGGFLAAAFVTYVFLFAPKLEHPIQTARRMHDFDELVLSGANAALLGLVGLCLPQMASVVGALWLAFALAIAGFI